MTSVPIVYGHIYTKNRLLNFIQECINHICITICLIVHINVPGLIFGFADKICGICLPQRIILTFGGKNNNNLFEVVQLQLMFEGLE